MLLLTKQLLVGALCVLCWNAAFLSPAWPQWDVTESTDKSKTIEGLQDKEMDMSFEPAKQVEMQADQMEYESGANVAKAKGNVVVTSGTTILHADQVELDRVRQQAKAQGNVYVDSPQLQVDASGGEFHFVNKTGTFNNARIFNEPFQLRGETVAKESDAHMFMENGYMTFCDHDEPHFRLATRRMDVYTGDKAVARGVKIFVGPVPVMYLPRYTQDLKNKPWFSFFPGHEKDLGYFLLTRSRIKVNPHWTMTLRVDAYERTGFGWGSDNKYDVPGYGSGLLRHYFINERQIAAKHPWKEKAGPTVQNERHKIEWRHKWDIDRRTTAVWQYYRLSDPVILKKYFEREFRVEGNPSTYFLLTRSLDAGHLSLRVDHRVNRFVEAVDRTPELNYSLASQAIGNTGFYLKDNTTISNLVLRKPSPTEDRRKTFRVDTDNEISYPTRIGFVQFTPMVGGDLTYYSRTIDARRPTDILRATFKTGADLSTRFFKVFNAPRGFRDMSKMRHIVAPSVAYRYQHKPTFDASRLNQFDTAIDALDHRHTVGFSLENKLQGKRGKNIVDLVRDVVSVDYLLRLKGRKAKLGPLANLLEITPAEWLRLVANQSYDFRKNRLTESNFDVYFVKANKFGFDIGSRFARGQEHQVTTQLAYVVNPKWKFKIYDRFALSTGQVKVEEYAITRDLHEWEMNVIYGSERGGGSHFLVTFKLKAFPDQPFDLFGTSFNQRKAGSQSSINE